MHLPSFKMALLASFIVGVRSEDSCLEGPFAGPAGHPHAGLDFPKEWDHDRMRCFAKYSDGNLITGFRAWATYDHIEAVQFRYATNAEWSPVHGWEPPEGTEHRRYQEATWSSDESVSVHMWNNRPKGFDMDAPGRVQIKKGDETIFDVSCAEERREGEELKGINQGSGFILGAKTQSGVDNKNWINTLEFLMLKGDLVNQQIIQLKLSEDPNRWNEEKKGIKMEQLDGLYIHNPWPKENGKNQTWDFSGGTEREMTTSTKIDWTYKGTVGGKISMKEGVGLVGFFSAGVASEASGSFEITYATSKSTETKRKVPIGWKLGSGAVGIPGPTTNLLEPQQALKCSAQVLSGEFSSRWTGIVQARFKDDTTFNYTVSGDFSSVGWSESAAHCDPWPIDKIPKDSELSTGIDID